MFSSNALRRGAVVSLLLSVLTPAIAFRPTVDLDHGLTGRSRNVDRASPARSDVVVVVLKPDASPPPPSSIVRCFAGATTNGDEDGRRRREMLDQASRLRREAEELESVVKSTRGDDLVDKAAATRAAAPAAYDRLEDSCWRLTYRFAKDPVDDNDENDDANNERPYYFSGKVDVRFRADGYTDLLDDDDDHDSTTTTTKCRFDKLWGWDKETSSQDGLDYLLFSADLSLRSPTEETSTRDRYYFNARVDTDGAGRLSLTDGTITAKRDVETTSTGAKLFWGIFNGGGILAQFRYVGNFSSRPIRKE